MIHHDQISKTVAAYLDRHPTEAARLAPLTAALTGSDDLTSRKTLTGHVTCSAIVVDPQRRVLHIRHNALRRWLRPGGHIEPSDTSPPDAALREIAEETGIPTRLLTLVDDTPVDVDAHPIPANPAKHESDHQHFDLRFVFTTSSDDVCVTLRDDEVHDFAWLPIEQVEPAALRAKIANLVT
ncbi:MAG TPA: NUDIX hydrolase [Micromonosporaceae bacterium]|jgi:8-oxo-dGTP pyrophosphatase MutT (NUDIX family)|nr:NUDIX hydrolase [Micromonosporaceae bacterium]